MILFNKKNKMALLVISALVIFSAQAMQRPRVVIKDIDNQTDVPLTVSAYSTFVDVGPKEKVTKDIILQYREDSGTRLDEYGNPVLNYDTLFIINRNKNMWLNSHVGTHFSRDLTKAKVEFVHMTSGPFPVALRPFLYPIVQMNKDVFQLQSQSWSDNTKKVISALTMTLTLLGKEELENCKIVATVE